MVSVSIVSVVIEVMLRNVTGIYDWDVKEFETRERVEKVKVVISEKITHVEIGEGGDMKLSGNGWVGKVNESVSEGNFDTVTQEF